MRTRHLLPAAFVALTSLLPLTAHADVSGAQTFVEKEHGHIRNLVDQNASSDQVRQAIDGMVDYDELASRTLGSPCPTQVPGCRNWKKEISQKDYEQIRDLLKQLVERNYHRNIKKTKDYEITYRGAKEAGENVSKVRTEAKSKLKPRDPAVQVDYVIMGGGDRYKVIDIVTEGSSMTKNYYDQSNKILSDPAKGIGTLIQKYKDRLAKNEESK